MSTAGQLSGCAIGVAAPLEARPDSCPAADTWFRLANEQQREAVAAPPIVGMTPNVEPRARAVGNPMAAAEVRLSSGYAAL